jgi:chromate transport protein ChrA
VPGPLFTFAAYFGAVVSLEPHGLAGAALGLLGIFLSGILVLLGALPFWDSFRKCVGAQAMMRGVNAAMVGVLGAALYDPVLSTRSTQGGISASLWSAFLVGRLARPSARRRWHQRCLREVLTTSARLTIRARNSCRRPA